MLRVALKAARPSTARETVASAFQRAAPSGTPSTSTAHRCSSTLPSRCSALRSGLLRRLDGNEAHSTGLRSILFPLESSSLAQIHKLTVERGSQSEEPAKRYTVERLPESPSQRRRLRKAERQVRRHAARHTARQLKAEATVQRLAARQAMLDGMRSEEVAAFLKDEREQRWRDSHHRGCRVEQDARVAHAFAHAPRVAIDLSFAATLSEVEQRSLWRQLQVCWGANRRAVAPLSLHLTSLAGCPSQGIEMGWPSERTPPSSAVERVRALGWTVGVHEGAVTEHFDRSSVIYLSPDADTVLETLQTDTVYVMGGLVDRSVRRGASLCRAAQLGVRAARLPLQEHAPSVHNGRLPLTLNAVLELLLHANAGGEWADAIVAALPERSLRPQSPRRFRPRYNSNEAV